MKGMMWKALDVKVKAFATIEYCGLIPVLLLLYTFLVYIGLFQYNRCLLQSNTCILGMKEKEVINQNVYEQVAFLQQKEQELYNEKYLLIENLQVNYCLNGITSTIQSSAQLSNPFAVFGLGKETWNLEAECQISNINSAEILRLCKDSMKLLEKLKEKEKLDAGT